MKGNSCMFVKVVICVFSLATWRQEILLVFEKLTKSSTHLSDMRLSTKTNLKFKCSLLLGIKCWCNFSVCKRELGLIHWSLWKKKYPSDYSRHWIDVFVHLKCMVIHDMNLEGDIRQHCILRTTKINTYINRHE